MAKREYAGQETDALEELLAQAVTETCLSELHALPDEEELAQEQQLSDGFLKRMERLVLRQKRRARLHKALVGCGRAAAVLLVVLLAGFGAAYAVSPQVRADTAGLLVEWFSDHNTFSGVLPDVSSGESREDMRYALGYLPEGYTQVEETNLGNTVLIFYKNAEEQEIMFEYILPGTAFTTAIDNERRSQEKIEINGNDAYLMVPYDPVEQNILLWNDGETNFTLYAMGDPKEIIRMAENVERVK